MPPFVLAIETKISNNFVYCGKKYIPLCILLGIFAAIPFADALHVSLRLWTLMQMAQLFINLVLKYPQSVPAGDTFFTVPPNFSTLNRNFAVEFAGELD